MNFQSLTLTECAAALGVKTDTLKKWHANGCPGEKDGSVWKFDTAKVFAWKLERGTPHVFDSLDEQYL